METFLYESFLELVRTLDCSFATPWTRVDSKLFFSASVCVHGVQVGLQWDSDYIAWLLKDIH